jgi:site-specific recombinase XerD
MLARSV